MPVDVGEEINPSVPDGSGGIGNDDRERFLQSKGGGAALGHRLNDAFLGPLRVVGEDEFRQFQRFLEVGVHQLHHFAQWRADADVLGRFDTPVAGLFERQNIFDTFDQGLVVQALDPVQRHVESPRRTGRRQPIAIDHVGLAGHVRGLGDFRQGRPMFRVDRAAIAIEQTGAAEKP